MPKIDPEVELTTIENLVVEVLVARYRLGEKVWSFDPSVGKSVSSLVKKGYVRQLSRKPGNLLSVALTKEAVALNLSYDYVPSIAADNPELAAAFTSVTDGAKQMRDDLYTANEPQMV